MYTETNMNGVKITKITIEKLKIQQKRKVVTVSAVLSTKIMKFFLFLFVIFRSSVAVLILQTGV